MARGAGVFSNHLFAALFLASMMLVKCIPTSVLVDTKQQEQIEKQPPSSSVYGTNKGMSK